MEDVTKIFKALSDPNRLRILKLLALKPLCVCEITDVLQLATSTVSKHLSILRDSGFILDEKNGKWVDYKINHKTKDKYVKQLLAKIAVWLDEEETIMQDLKKIKKVNRIVICNKK